MVTLSKIDKEVLITLTIVVVALLLVSFVIYKYINGGASEVKNVTGGAQTEIKAP